MGRDGSFLLHIRYSGLVVFSAAAATSDPIGQIGTRIGNGRTEEEEGHLQVIIYAAGEHQWAVSPPNNISEAMSIWSKQRGFLAFSNRFITRRGNLSLGSQDLGRCILMRTPLLPSTPFCCSLSFSLLPSLSPLSPSLSSRAHTQYYSEAHRRGLKGIRN